METQKFNTKKKSSIMMLLLILVGVGVILAVLTALIIVSPIILLGFLFWMRHKRKMVKYESLEETPSGSKRVDLARRILEFKKSSNEGRK